MTRLPDDRYFEIHADDDIRIAGTRVGLEHLLEGYLAGATAEQLTVDFPSVSLEQVHGVIAYYLRHEPLVDEYLHAALEKSLNRQRTHRADLDVVRRFRQMAK